MLWLALHLPDLSLQAWASTWLTTGQGADIPATAGPVSAADRVPFPLALMARHRITAANAMARARGVQAGQKRATALALVPELQLAEAQPAHDQALLQAVVHVALVFTPQVCTEGPATVLLEVQTSLRCFGGPAALQQRLWAALAPLGLAVQLGVAPTPLAAAWLAVWRPLKAPDPQALQAPHVRQLSALHTLLDQAPLALLDAAASSAATMATLGLHRLGELQALPRAGLARRFGTGVLDTLDRAYGLRPDPRQPVQPAATFEARLELQARADDSEQLAHAALLLLPRLLAWAAARQSRVAAFSLHLLHETRHRGDDTPPSTALHIELAEPSLDLAHLQSLLRERLQRLALPAPTLDLHLLCQHTVQGAPPNGELFPTRQVQALGLVRLLERLRARLGEDQVLRPAPVADHRPERANRLRPVHTTAGPAPDGALPVPTPGWPLQRPLWLLPEPVPLAERDEQPCWGGQPLRLLAGPERVETGWWDQAPALRDYYIAQTAGGGLVWVFRDRLCAGGPALTAEATEAVDAGASWPPPGGARRPRPRGEPLWFLQGQFG